MFSGATLRAQLNNDELDRLIEALASKKPREWLGLKSAQGPSLWLDTAAIVAVEVIKRSNAEPVKGCVSLAEIAHATGIAHRKLIYRVEMLTKEDPHALEKVSERRWAITDNNMKLLGVSKEAQKKLRELECDRVGLNAVGKVR